MSTGLTVYQQVGDPGSFITEMGKAIAKSKLLGCESESQGLVMAMTCYAKGTDPLSLSQKYHIIQNRLSMKADYMLAEFRSFGGRHKIVQRDAAAAEISLTIDGETENFRLTWDDAKQEPFTKDKKGNVSANYATPRKRMQMLWARVVSDGVRAMAPEVNSGAYTPEEISDFPENEGTAEVVIEQDIPETVDNDAEEATFEPAKPKTSELPKAHGQQIRRITELFQAIGVPGDAQLAALKKRGANDMGDLSPEGASDLIAALESRLSDQNDEVTGESNADPAAIVTRNDSPIDDVTLAEVRNLLQQASQWPGGADLGDRLLRKLNDSGLARLADLSIADAEIIKQAVATKNIELFFDASIQGHNGAIAKNG